VLLPRPKGFTTTVTQLEGVIDYVYDVTLSYSGWKGFPGPFDMLFLNSKQDYALHMHIKRIPVKSLPKDEEGLKKWLFISFQEKEKLLSIFKQQGHFPDHREIEKVNPKEFWFPFFFWITVLISSASVAISTFCWIFC